MKGCLVLVLLVVVIFAIALPLLGGTNQIPQGIRFDIEENPAYVGSYNITRENEGSTWNESGEWSRTEFNLTLGGPTVCFGYHPKGVFRSSAGFQWKKIRQLDGRTCVRLVRK